MKLKIKRLHPDAVLPSYAKPGDAGLDLTATSLSISEDGLYVEYGTGIAVEIPEGHVGLIFPRSSISKTSMILSNHVGVIDSGYRGEIRFRFKDLELDTREFESDILNRVQELRNHKNLNKLTGPKDNVVWVASDTSYLIGDKIGQLIVIPYPQIEIEEVDELTETERSEGGFGSTGN